MLVELAIGDAYGAGFEYASDKIVHNHNDLSGYIQHPRHAIPPGCYTDDTQMSIAIAESIVSGESWTPRNLASRFLDTFKRDPREGYAGGFYAFLQQCPDADAFLRDIRPESDKSGAAMRAIPLGVFPSIDTVIKRCTVQAKLTHDTPDGVNAALAASLMAHYFLYNLGPKAELSAFLTQHVAGPWTPTWKGKVSAQGWMSVQAALTAVMSSNSLSEILKASIAFTGDVDTVATIALGAASCAQEVANDLPQLLYNRLENNAYGRDYLLHLDKQLLMLVEYRGAN
ncbi:MAG: ADP-ribosylglycohydrolase family protein [Chloroflexi bacterium AL-W]|nr:ADP-ribosylglycohydrolase family protein [Chloroflexi bacterium AL-N1]NOK64779.1 ADP-ribosylglycohydrolase family protein [Chloroflexi bacterium AL-N10]NOK76549.1 ADP-ribosylglycohydrolase family protein [Chloroflexi bacterium AL-N5]NOK80221.1 ADP-ribosylglycohydrolase family protein [Chloroflexi bacterium AL-W]NOK86734.1 ADP-ribosylglycohydrolase family protein [Chloroflexi bacterium AL-N15]